MLFAISMLAMKRDGDLTKFQMMRAEKLPWLLSNSILSLLAEIKAISLPEEKAEKSRVMTIRLQSDMR